MIRGILPGLDFLGGQRLKEIDISSFNAQTSSAPVISQKKQKNSCLGYVSESGNLKFKLALLQSSGVTALSPNPELYIRIEWGKPLIWLYEAGRHPA